jgi:hypothetical protein
MKTYEYDVAGARKSLFVTFKKEYFEDLEEVWHPN